MYALHLYMDYAQFICYMYTCICICICVCACTPVYVLCAHVSNVHMCLNNAHMNVCFRVYMCVQYICIKIHVYILYVCMAILPYIRQHCPVSCVHIAILPFLFCKWQYSVFCYVMCISNDIVFYSNGSIVCLQMARLHYVYRHGKIALYILRYILSCTIQMYIYMCRLTYTTAKKIL